MTWRVWDTLPLRGAAFGPFRAGWLTFDDGAERRRLAPIPPGWAELPVERLAALLRQANPAGIRR